MIRVYPISALQGAGLWQRFRPQLLEALRHGNQFTEAEAQELVLTGEATLHVVEQDDRPIAFLATVVEEAYDKFLTVWLYAGDASPPVLERVHRYLLDQASQAGAVGVRLAGRPGWRKILRGLGYRPVSCTLEHRHVESRQAGR